MAEPSSAGMLQALFQAGTAIANAADAAKRNALLVDFQKVTIESFSKLAELQMANARLEAEKRELEKECVRLMDWTAEKSQYRMRHIAPGVFAYLKNDAGQDLESTHKLCCNCFDKSIKSTLQQSREITQREGTRYFLTCPNGCPKLIFTHYINP